MGKNYVIFNYDLQYLSQQISEHWVLKHNDNPIYT